MSPNDLPRLELHSLAGGPEVLVLCSSARLAAGLRRAHGLAQAARDGKPGHAWLALHTATLSQWLDHVTSAALIRGEIPPGNVPGVFLTALQERSVWEQAVTEDVARAAPAARPLFDREGLARTAQAAERMQQAWQLKVPDALRHDEYSAFLRWQARVREVCHQGGWCTADQVMAWRIHCLARGAGELPAKVGIAGFVAPDPWLVGVLAVLTERGTTLFQVDFGHARPPVRPAAIECPDALSECRAVSAWAARRLQKDPGSRLRIAVGDLPARKRLLCAALDARLAGIPGGYALAGGEPLAEMPLIAVALRLLRVAVHSRALAHADWSALLCGTGWSADVTEADVRAQLDVRLREVLPSEFGLERLCRSLLRQAGSEAAPALVEHLVALRDHARAMPKRLRPGAWGRFFAEVLSGLGWPGQRPLAAIEAEASEGFRQILDGLAALDAIRGPVGGTTALRLLVRHCRDRMFEPSRARSARVEVCSLEDAVAEPVDGLWVMGLEDGVWPRSPNPNPLIPVESQRHAGILEARPDLLTIHAKSVQALWCAGAGEVVLSWPGCDGDRVLRPSSLLAGFERAAFVPDPAWAPDPSSRFEIVEDAQAPPMAEGAALGGGTAVLKAQALCPAWAFHRYRLGVRPLATPGPGLDARARGMLVHAALESFWQGQSRASALDQPADALGGAIAWAIAQAIDRHDRRVVDPLSPPLRMLEQKRLARLLGAWLAVERVRPDFVVVECEGRHTLSVGGLMLKVAVDRVDRLADGRLVVIDYKTGMGDTPNSWAGVRISEPQLPIYAALVFAEIPLAAAALARVVPDAPGFAGLAEGAGLLPEVKSLDEQRRRYAEADFPDWISVRQRWAERLTGIAAEIREGHAAVSFMDEKDLARCEVRPLLRLAERRRLLEEGV